MCGMRVRVSRCDLRGQTMCGARADMRAPRFSCAFGGGEVGGIVRARGNSGKGHPPHSRHFPSPRGILRGQARCGTLALFLIVSGCWGAITPKPKASYFIGSAARVARRLPKWLRGLVFAAVVAIIIRAGYDLGCLLCGGGEAVSRCRIFRGAKGNGPIHFLCRAKHPLLLEKVRQNIGLAPKFRVSGRGLRRNSARRERASAGARLRPARFKEPQFVAEGIVMKLRRGKSLHFPTGLSRR